MSAAVKLTIITGPHKTDRYCFRDRTVCELGRAPDCTVELAGFPRDERISRHHCRFRIDPPHVWITDLGSTNGTYINGKQLEPALTQQITEEVRVELSLQDGDVLTVGGTTLQINVIDCPFVLGDPPECEESDCDDAGDAPPCNGECLLKGHAHLLADGMTVLWKVDPKRSGSKPHS